MQAKMKCSNCGAEVSNLTVSHAQPGWKQWIWFPIAFLPLILVTYRTERAKPDFTKELSARLVEVRREAEKIDVIGKIANRGTHDWQSVTVKAEFYDKDGKYLDEGSYYIPGSVRPSAEDNFKVTVTKPSKNLSGPGTRVEIRVAGANNYNF